MVPRTVEDGLERILERVRQFQNQEDKVLFLTQSIYHAIPDMFEKRLFDPVGIEIHYEHGEQKIYAWELAENIARRLLGLEMQKAKGDTWEDAQRRAGYI